MARPKREPGSREELTAWLADWIDRQRAERRITSREQACERSYDDLPAGFLPSPDDLMRQWWVRTFGEIVDQEGLDVSNRYPSR